jgi:DNA-binding protein HU-beta
MAGVNDIVKASGVSSGNIKLVTDAILTLVKTGQDVRIQGFGTFSKLHKDERAGRNPSTGEALTIAAKDVLKFKPSKDVDMNTKPASRRR